MVSCIKSVTMYIFYVLVVYLIESGSPADIKEQQPQYTNGDCYQLIIGDRDQKTQDLRRKTEELESQLKDNSDYEEQEPTPAVKKFEKLERKLFQEKGKHAYMSEHVSK